MFEIYHSLSFVGFAFVIFISVGLVLQIVAVIDLIRSDFKDPNGKLIWAIIVIFLGMIGTILYFAYGIKQKNRH